MAIYSKQLDDKKILSLIPDNSKKILIVACGGCVNESLAFDKNMPILCNGMPYASRIEAEKISALLESHGFETKITVLDGDLPVLCIFTADSDKMLLCLGFEPDAILALSCKSGEIGLRLATDKPVISITRQVGYISYTYKDEDGKRWIIKEKSTCSLCSQ